jgi:hypothetical protein
LPHELVVKTFLEVGVGEGGERLEYGAPGRADDCVHLADCRECLFERSLVGDVDVVFAYGRFSRDFLKAPCKRRACDRVANPALSMRYSGVQ